MHAKDMHGIFLSHVNIAKRLKVETEATGEACLASGGHFLKLEG